MALVCLVLPRPYAADANGLPHYLPHDPGRDISSRTIRDGTFRPGRRSSSRTRRPRSRAHSSPTSTAQGAPVLNSCV